MARCPAFAFIIRVKGFRATAAAQACRCPLYRPYPSTHPPKHTSTPTHNVIALHLPKCSCKCPPPTSSHPPHSEAQCVFLARAPTHPRTSSLPLDSGPPASTCAGESGAHVHTTGVDEDGGAEPRVLPRLLCAPQAQGPDSHVQPHIGARGGRLPLTGGVVDWCGRPAGW